MAQCVPTSKDKISAYSDFPAYWIHFDKSFFYLHSIPPIHSTHVGPVGRRLLVLNTNDNDNDNNNHNNNNKQQEKEEKVPKNNQIMPLMVRPSEFSKQKSGGDIG